MRGLHRHLKPGGIFILNCVQFVTGRPDKPFTKIGERIVGEIIYRQFDSSEQIDPSRRKVTWKFEVEYRGKILEEHSEDFYLQMDSKEGLRSLLEVAGFRVRDVFGSYGREPMGGQKPGFVVIAQRA